MFKSPRFLAMCLVLSGISLSCLANAATLTVSNLNDTGPGSLRAQVAAAAAGDSIDFSVTGTITLTGGQIAITRDLTIIGPGAGSLTVSGDTISSLRSIFNISGGIVDISGLTLSRGRGTFFTVGSVSIRSGGAFLITGGNVTVTNCNLSDNGNGTVQGGAIFMAGGGLTMADCTLSRNLARDGGVIYLRDVSAATITNCTLSDNDAEYGGAVYTIGSTAAITIRNSTLSGNDATFAGGGILTNDGPLTIASSTLSGNLAKGISNGRGGAIYIAGTNGGTTITNSTITGNVTYMSATAPVSGGGGINSFGPVSMSHTIVCGNSAQKAGGENISYNTVITGTNNLIDQNAMLGVLTDNGGPTKTHALLPGSPAIDAGDPAFDATNTPHDQRGSGYARVQAGRVDIGAYESDTPQSGGNFIVNTLADTDDGIAGTTHCTLREAVKYAPAGTVITFSVSGTITLTDGQLIIAKNLTIQGPAGNPGITVSGNNTSRIFRINSAAVNFSMLTLSGGNSTSLGNGGAILNAGGTVTIASSTFSGNTANSLGGAISNSGTLTVENSTFSGNSAITTSSTPSGGGAIFCAIDRSLTIVNCTFSANSANSPASTGGAIRNIGALSIANSTFSGNSAATGGGIYTTVGVVTLTNSIVAGNGATNSPDLDGIFAPANYNLIQDTTGATLTGANNITGQSAGLDTLKSGNGGPTATMALLAGSPAFDAGDPNFDTTNTPYDQRGAGFARKSSGAIDIGAYEVQVSPPDTTPPTISISAPSVTLANPGGSVTYTVTYADANFSSSTLSASDVTLNRAGAIDASVSVTSTSVTTRTVTLSGITAYGTLGISIVAGTATDISGNTAPAAGPSGAFSVNPSVETVRSSGTIHEVEGGGSAIGYVGNPGQEYTIQFSPDLLPPWQTLATPAANSSGVISIIDNPPAGTARRFYRLLLP